MTKILDLNSKEDAKKKIVQLNKEIAKLQAIVDKKDTLFDRIKTIDDVFEELKIKKLTYFEHFPEEIRDKMEACYHIGVIAKLFNGDWKPDWTNQNEYKWYPYFTISSTGGLFFDDTDYHYYHSYGGVAYFKDKETATFVGKQFTSIYNKLK